MGENPRIKVIPYGKIVRCKIILTGLKGAYLTRTGEVDERQITDGYQLYVSRVDGTAPTLDIVAGMKVLYGNKYPAVHLSTEFLESEGVLMAKFLDMAKYLATEFCEPGRGEAKVIVGDIKTKFVVV